MRKLNQNNNRVSNAYVRRDTRKLLESTRSWCSAILGFAFSPKYNNIVICQFIFVIVLDKDKKRMWKYKNILLLSICFPAENRFYLQKNIKYIKMCCDSGDA